MSTEAQAASHQAANVGQRWEATFAKFDAGNTGLFAWSFLGFLFGPLYYFYLRMWAKGLALLVLGLVLLVLESMAHSLFGTPETVRAIELVPSFLAARYVKRDYYMFVRHGETGWPGLPLSSKHAVIAGAALCTLLAVIFFMPPSAKEDRDELIDDVSGVWHGADVTLATHLKGIDKTIQINGRTIKVKVKTADNSDGILVLAPESSNNVVTLRRVWKDDKHDSFHLTLSLDDGTMVKLEYIRPE